MNLTAIMITSMRNRSVPADIILPHLCYRDIDTACGWLSRAFGFREVFRYGEPLSGIQMRMGKAFIMLYGAKEWSRSPEQLGSGTQMLTIFVDDVDEHYKRSVDAGAKIIEELHETVYGERQYGAEDLDGHRWLFSQHVRDVSPAEWGAIIAKS
jgi:uncharacterized glyoxalase superfamily protein PhnB